MSEARRGRRMPFVIMPWAVLEDETLTAHDVLVYATIARYADVTTGVAWPSRATVAAQARCDIKTVDRCVTRLVAAGFLEKHKRKNELGESNLYVVHEIVARQETLNQQSRGRGTNGATPRDSNGAGTRTNTTRRTGPVRMDTDARRRPCDARGVQAWGGNMRTIYGFAYGVILTLLAITYIVKPEPVEPEIHLVDRTVVEQVMTTIDLDRIRDTTGIDPDLDVQLAAECVHLIARETGEPIGGITHYIARYWQNDACAAAEHLLIHGWY